MPTGNVFFTRDHAWLRVDGAEVTIGITHHAQQALGDITFVDLPKIGKVMKAHDTLLIVESIKAASEIQAPVSGTVSAINDRVVSSPELINQSAQVEGWLCKLKPFTLEAQNLLTAGQYDAFLKES